MANQSKIWGSAEADADLIRMRSVEHQSWIAIALVFGCSKTSCHKRYTTIVPASEQVRISARKKWNAEDEATVYRLRYDEKKSLREIAALLNRTTGQIDGKLQRMKTPNRRVHFEQTNSQFIIPARCLIERDRRYAIAPRDLTAAFCGDPLPGYSALERRA